MEQDRKDAWQEAWMEIHREPMAMRVCPSCWALVPKMKVEAHEGWHQDQTGSSGAENA